MAENSDDEKRIARSRKQASVEKKQKEKQRDTKTKYYYKKDKNYNSNYRRDYYYNDFSNSRYDKYNYKSRACYICEKEDHFLFMSRETGKA